MNALFSCFPAARCLPAALILAGAWCHPGRAQSLETFEDWMLGCNNRRHCVALGLESKNNVNGVYLRVLRSGEAHAEPAVKITAYAAERGPSRLRFAFDDPTLPVPAELAPSQSHGRESVEVSLPRETVRSFLEALPRAKTLSVTVVQGTHTTPPAVISLSGATAAFASMDEQQKRAGTATALVSRGTEPAARVPTPPSMPIVRAAKPATAKLPSVMPKPVAAAVEKTECDEAPETRPIRAWLDERTLLWGVLCSRGAYRETYAFFIYRTGARAGEPAALRMPGLRAAEGAGNSLTNPQFEGKTGVLRFQDLGRSMGDCGEAGRFVWDGTAFQPVELRAMPECRGVSYDDWPVTWRAELDHHR